MKNIIFQIPKKVVIGFSKSNETTSIIEEMGLKRVLISDEYPKILIINFLNYS